MEMPPTLTWQNETELRENSVEIRNHIPGQTVNVWLTVNRACNLRCNWCYAKDTDFAQKDTMTLDMVDRLLGTIDGLTVGRVVLIGGEPTIHPNFLEIVRRVKAKGHEVALVSNSIRFGNRDFLEAAIESGLDSILTSLKGGSADSYGKNAGAAGAYKKVMRAIANIDSSGIAHEVSIAPGEATFEEFAELLQSVTESGTRRLHVDTERPVLLNSGMIAESSPDCAEIEQFVVSAYPLLRDSGLHFTVKVTIPFCNFDEDFIEKLMADGHLSSGCHIYSGKGLIFDSHGKILACNHLCDNPLGEVGVDFSDAKGYSAFRQRDDVVSFYKDMNQYPDKHCVSCKHWVKCGAGCKIRWLAAGASQLIGHYRKAGKQSEGINSNRRNSGGSEGRHQTTVGPGVVPAER